ARHHVPRRRARPLRGRRRPAPRAPRVRPRGTEAADPCADLDGVLMHRVAVLSQRALSMKFSIVHTFDAPPAAVAEAMLDPEMPKFLLENHPLMEEAIPQERKEEGSVVKRKVRYRPRPIIKKVGPKEIPPDYLSFIEESTFDKSTMKGEFTNNAI